MREWAYINQRLEKFLGKEDEVSGKNLKSEPLRIYSWNWAQSYFVHHTPRQRTEELQVESGGRVAILPPDCMEIRCIYDSDEERYWWMKDWGQPGSVHWTDPETLEFWEWNGQLHLDSSVTAERLTLYYWAYWPEVEFTEDEDGNVQVTAGQILTPRWAESALLHLTTAHILQPLEMESANISQYKQRIDSGNPEHNPRAQSAWFHWRWYEVLVNKVPPARGRSG